MIVIPIYEYECRMCGSTFEKIEKISTSSWKVVKKKEIYCTTCGSKRAYRVPSSFKIGTGILETTGKSGYETDDLTLGKLIDEGGIPAEEKRRLRKRDKMIKRQKKYTKELNKRAKKYEFDPVTDE